MTLLSMSNLKCPRQAADGSLLAGLWNHVMLTSAGQRPAALASRKLGLCAAAAIFAGCAGGAATVPAAPAAITATDATYPGGRSRSGAGYVYVSNRTAQGSSELLVYPEGIANPPRLRTITRGLVDVAGVTTDAAGDVYVANGRAGNVLEFAPGGTSLVATYSIVLIDPVGVTVANGTLYVSDAGDGGAQQVFEYAIGNGTPTIAIGGLGDPPQLNRGIAVNGMGSQGTFFVAASSASAIPPRAGCLVSATYVVGEELMPTLWAYVPLSHNAQVSGVAFDSQGNMYVADPCAADVVIYSLVDYAWTYSGKVSGAFRAPFLLTIEHDVLAIPSARGSTPAGNGYVTVIDKRTDPSNVTITDGLQHPVGAAVGFGP
jgi:hypothetical protein